MVQSNLLLFPNDTSQHCDGAFSWLVGSIKEGVVIISLDHTIQFVNASFSEMVGLSATSCISRLFDEFLSPEDKIQFEMSLTAQPESIRTYTLTSQNGEVITIQVNAKSVEGPGDAAYFLMVSNMWTGPFQGMAEIIPQIIWTAEPDGVLDYYNQHWYDYTGFKRDTISTQYHIGSVVHPDDLVNNQDKWRHSVATGEIYEAQSRLRRGSDGMYRWHLARAVPVRGDDGSIIKWFGTTTDIDDQKQAEEIIRHQALYDSLTGLPNRTFIEEQTNTAIQMAQITERWLAILFLDLDRFKNINDSLGHAVGDALLREVARRLQRVLKSDQIVARLGGDEFAILLPNIVNAEEVEQVCISIFETLSGPIVIDGQEMHTDTSIGIAVYPRSSQDAATLFKHADIALYRAKEQGRNTYRFYTQAVDLHIQNKLILEEAVRKAIKNEEFLLHFQPIVKPSTGETVALEGLLRWNRPEMQAISPQDIISISEEVGMIRQLTKWTLDCACRQMCELRDAGFEQVKVAVNLSARQFTQQNLVEVIGKQLEECGVDPAMFRVEITENFAMYNLDLTLGKLNALKKTGVEAYLDDFGTGYSSLSYLKRFPLQCLKIDKSFINDCVTSIQDATIVRAIISMAHSLDLRVIAEGVENKGQYILLQELECDALQGYFISRPLAPEAVLDFVRKNNGPV